MAGPLSKSHATATLVLGICELLCGILVIILAIVAAQKADLNAGLSPWWAGVVFAIPGIIGIVVGCTKNHCAMIAFMVLNIIAFILQGIGAILAGIVIAVWSSAVSDVTQNCRKIYGTTCRCRTDSGDTFDISGLEDCDEISALFSTITAMLVFLVIAAIIALGGSILGCIAVCCTNNQSQGGVVLQTQTQPPPAYYVQQTTVKQ